MNFNDQEFDCLTSKLENYASQVSALQTRIEMQEKQNEMQAEIDSLKEHNVALNEELDKTRAELLEAQNQLAAAMAERDVYRQEVQSMHNTINSKLVESAFLMNCIMLSLSNVKDFMQMVKRFDVKALFYTFMCKTIAPQMGSRGLEAVNSVVELNDTTGLEKLADQLILDNRGNVNHE